VESLLEVDFVYVILNSSISGAGLILVIYALIIPLTQYILAGRARDVVDKLENFQTLVEGVGTATSSEHLRGAG
jgi:hypothetical protein